MKRRFALPSIAVVGLVTLSRALISPAAAQAPPPGTLLTVAGSGQHSFSGDGGPAIKAALHDPLDLTIDAVGNVYLADAGNNRIRKVGLDGTITTVAGSGPVGPFLGGFSGDGGPANQARLSEPEGVLAGPAGELFIADSWNDRVRRVGPDGTITTVAGSGPAGPFLGGFSGDGGPATAASLYGPRQLALDLAGNLYIADADNRRIRKVDSAGVITTVAGGGEPSDGRGDGGQARDARLRYPRGVAVDRVGNLYIADFQDQRVRRVSPDGTIRTVAGGGNPADGVGDGSLAIEARLQGPRYLALDPGGNLFIADNRGERIRKVDPAGIISTVAGTGQMGRTGDGGLATAARLDSPNSVSVDRAGNLFFTEAKRWQPDGAYPENNNPDNDLVREVLGAAVPQ